MPQTLISAIVYVLPVKPGSSRKGDFPKEVLSLDDSCNGLANRRAPVRIRSNATIRRTVVSLLCELNIVAIILRAGRKGCLFN